MTLGMSDYIRLWVNQSHQQPGVSTESILGASIGFISYWAPPSGPSGTGRLHLVHQLLGVSIRITTYWASPLVTTDPIGTSSIARNTVSFVTVEPWFGCQSGAYDFNAAVKDQCHHPKNSAKMGLTTMVLVGFLSTNNPHQLAPGGQLVEWWLGWRFLRYEQCHHQSDPGRLQCSQTKGLHRVDLEQPLVVVDKSSVDSNISSFLCAPHYCQSFTGRKKSVKGKEKWSTARTE
ncbi:hypothetical protein ZHAS_00018416 [Anopheles sinensis]|uniref:Uncharacterized protein n=1 Tax=Anopheles sinensis TaxID=74873 RepID=A0A084WJJ8_ANOSI|nr:hypothetical protein ZHAS_00018416 [Anopheles sinensis]